MRKFLDLLMSYQIILYPVVVMIFYFGIYYIADDYYSRFGIRFSDYAYLPDAIFFLNSNLRLLVFSIILVFVAVLLLILQISLELSKQKTPIWLVLLMSVLCLAGVFITSYGKESSSSQHIFERRLFNPTLVRMKDQQALHCVKSIGKIGAFSVFVNEFREVFLIRYEEIRDITVQLYPFPREFDEEAEKNYVKWWNEWEEVCPKNTSGLSRNLSNSEFIFVSGEIKVKQRVRSHWTDKVYEAMLNKKAAE